MEKLNEANAKVNNTKKESEEVSMEIESGEKVSGCKESAENESGEKVSGCKESAENESGEKVSGCKESAEKESGEKVSGYKESAEKESGKKEYSEKKSGKKVPKKIIVILIVFIFTCIAVSPLGTYLRSMAVMGIYSKICEADGIPAYYNFELDIPGGGETFEDDWYPFVMTFNDDSGFSRHVGVPDSRLTILYNFPSFSVSKGCSRLYDTESPYYSGFYGAYLVNLGNGEPYGVDTDGNVNTEEVAVVSMYDYRTLVLSDFGLSYSDFKYDFSTEKITYNHEISGITGWTRCSGILNVPGCSHVKDGFVRSYLQYGPPEFECGEPFAPVEMESIIYAKYFKEINTSIFLYIMVPGEEEAAVTEEEILKNTLISF